MSKNCLNKLTGNILVNCALPTHGVKDIYLVYTTDVTLTHSADFQWITSVTFAEGAKSYKVEGYKQNLQVTTALRTTDVSARFDVSVSFKASLATASSRGIMTGRFFVLAVPPVSDGASSTYTFWGDQAPLECTNVEYDSNANGQLVTYTLSAPEGSAGNNPLTVADSAAQSIITKSV